MNPFRRYLRWMILPLAAGGLSIAGFNAGVDPFGLTRLITIKGFNENKVLVVDHRRLVKAYRIRQMKPRGLMLGTSQADGGLDPGYPGWPADAQPVFNAGLPYANAYEMLRYFQHAIACGQVREAVVGLDLVSFNAFLANQSDFSESRLAVDQRGQWQHPPVDERIGLLLSLDATRKSIETIRRQGENAPVDSGIGYRGRFQLIEAEYMHYMWRHGPQRTFSLRDEATGRTYIDEYRRLLETARDHDVRLHPFFSPVHAQLLESLHALGWWSLFEEWKRAVLRVTTEVNAAEAGDKVIELWDFADYTSVTTETVPPPGDITTRMSGYEDAAHYTRAVGNFVMDRIFHVTRPGADLPSDFGVLLDTGSFDDHLASVRERAGIYRASRRDDVNEIEAIAAMKHGDAMSKELDRLRETSRSGEQ